MACYSELSPINGFGVSKGTKTKHVVVSLQMNPPPFLGAWQVKHHSPETRNRAESNTFS
jgi:hypothetical protein